MDGQGMPSHHEIEADGTAGSSADNITGRLPLRRASCRNFSERPVPSVVLDLILDAGVHAATGGTLRPYSIIQIEDVGVRRELARRCGQPSMGRAPMHLLFCIDWHRPARSAALGTAPFSATKSFRPFVCGGPEATGHTMPAPERQALDVRVKTADGRGAAITRLAPPRSVSSAPPPDPDRPGWLCRP